MTQTHDALIIDGFAGGGGASAGIEMALGRSPDYAINHDPAALAMHEANHPETVHLVANVWQVSLRELIGQRKIGMIWISPDCRHHSKAKGGAPVSESVRGLAWVLMRWLKELRPAQYPDHVYLENVEEFRKWGPTIDDGKGGRRPDPTREGETFKAWVRELKRYGYKHLEFRELRANWYGTPTIRKRLYVIASRVGPVVWPAHTHGAPASDEVRDGRLKPWPVAADIIDWNRPCPSIFLTKADAKAAGLRVVRPLAPNTDARIAKGVKRYVLDAASPFIVTCNHAGEGFRGQAIDDPFATVTRARDAHGVVVPHIMTMRNSGKPRTAADEPVHTVTAGGAGLSVVESAIAPFVTYGQQGGASRPADEPHHTVTASRKDTNAVASAFLVPRYGERPGQEPRTRDIDEPYPTAVASGNGGDLAAVFLAQHNGNRIGQAVEEPAPTLTTRGTQTHQVAAYLAQHNTDVVGHDARSPVSTIVGKGCTQGVVAAHMLSLKGSDRRAGDALDPVGAVCAGGQHAAVVSLPLVTAYYSEGGQHADIGDPMLTVPTRARFGLVEADAAPPPLSDAQLSRAKQVAAFLRLHDCWDGGELVTLELRGETWIVVDIGMRMLTARELARAQGFPETYVLAAPFAGRTLSDTEQRHKIGNSVCRRVAAALVAANSGHLAAMQAAAE